MHFPTGRDFGFFEKERRLTSKNFLKELRRRVDVMSPAVAAAMMKRENVEAREEERQMYKRDLSGRANGTIDPWVSLHFSLSQIISILTSICSAVRLFPSGHVYRLRLELHFPVVCVSNYIALLVCNCLTFITDF